MSTKRKSMAEFVDGLLLEGITWEKLESRCKAEAKRRDTNTLSTLSQIKGHVRYRASQTKRWAVERTDVGVRMNAVAPQPKATKAKAAKPEKKTGKPNRRKATKTNGNAEPAPGPAVEPEQKPEAA
jgi:hypothetical protein